MTIKYFLSETRRFLQSPKPEVLCVTGTWGVGKTFGWNSSLRSAIEENHLALTKYAYVSLFGKNAIEDVKMSIVENTTEGSNIGGQPTTAGFSTHVDRLKSIVKGNSWVARFIPGLASFAPAFNRLLFLDVRNQLICLDDLERIGSGIGIKEILGLISELKEQKSCKVVLLLNRGDMAKEDQEILKAQIEKVADVFLDFSPVSSEAVEIALDKKADFYHSLRDCCLRLNLVNIRVLKQIERMCHRINEVASSFDDRLMQSAVHTAALAGYAHMQPKEAPPLAFIRSFNSMAGLVTRHAGGKDAEEPDRAMKDLLSRYGFNSVSELDAIIIDGVERGAFHDEDLRAAFHKGEKALKTSDKNRSFEVAWNNFRKGFGSADDEVLDAMIAGIKENFEAIRPAYLSQTLLFLKEFGREKGALEALEVYVSHRDEAAGFWNLNDYSHFEEITDPDLRAAFAKKFAELSPAPPTPVSVLKGIAKSGGWNAKDMAFLASLSVDDFIRMFKDPDESEHEILIPGALYFRNMGGVTAEMKAITLKAEAALYRIAHESKMSARRIKYWGLDIENYQVGDNEFIVEK